MAVTEQTNVTLAQFAEALGQYDNIVVCGHLSPDGDCIGSTLGLVHALRALGKQVTGLCVDPMPGNLAFLPGASDLVRPEDFSGSCQAFVSVDVPNEARIKPVAAAIRATAQVTFTLDHHAYPERISDYSYTDPGAAATALLVWELAGLLGARNRDVAQCCYAGLMTDSGGFKYANTDARAFRAAAQMLEAGVDPAYTSTQLVESDPEATLAMEAVAFCNRYVNHELGYAISTISAREFAENDAVYANAEGAISFLRRIKGMRCVCILKEHEGAVRLSFRGKDGVNVKAMAEQFGGGGHIGAAGATASGTLEEVRDQVIRVIEEALR